MQYIRKNITIISIIFGISITILVTILFVNWFVFADRNIVFLYYHDMGPLIPSTAPFSFVTSSRYWMSGLVASGAVMILYTVSNAILHLAIQKYNPPAWHAVWIIPAVALTFLIPVITMMTPKSPSLPLQYAFKVTIVTITGLALALQPGRLAGSQLRALPYLAMDGLGISLLLVSAPAVERLPGWLVRGDTIYIILLGIMIFSGLLILLVMSGVRLIFKQPADSALTMYISGFCIAYPGLSILHHVLFTDGYFYITDSDNFLARNPILQVVNWAICWLLCVGITRLRVRLIFARSSHKDEPIAS